VNIDRLLREVETRLQALPTEVRSEAVDAVREALARERRRDQSPENVVEVERQRRLEAETLRDILEAINRQASLEQTIDEVLKQLARIVAFDSCSLALHDGNGSFRIIAVRGFLEPERIVGLGYRDGLSEEIRQSRWPAALADVEDDPRFVRIEGSERVRSWAGIPLLVEGEVIGLLCLDRHRVEPFDEEDLHRAKAVAFSAAAAIRKAQLHEQVRRYATLMERVVEVDQAVFADKPLADLAHLILDGALRLGKHASGFLSLHDPGGPRVAAAAGAFAGTEGRTAPLEAMVTASARLLPAQAAALGEALGQSVPAQSAFLVPLATAHAELGCLALLDPDGETPDDRLMEAYASRAAAAYWHAVRMQGRH
jgi:GAF domain-containing protein